MNASPPPDPEAPRVLGDLEDAEPERRAPIPKKTLEEFLEEFEARLRDHPGQAATSATAALEGRAEGAWRTPIEGVERVARRLPRRAAARPVAATDLPAPAALPEREPAREPEPATEPVPAIPPQLAAEPEPLPVPVPLPTEAEVAEPVAGVEAAPAAPGKRRHRHRRHHRHR